MARSVEFADRLMERVEMDPNGGCWLWSGSLVRGGYGVIRRDGEQLTASRASYECFVGPANGLYVLHKCDVRACINPAHLFLGTHAENMADMKRKGRAYRLGAPRGSNNTNARLSEDQVREMLASPESSYAIARRLPVTACMVRRIRRGLAWSHVARPADAIGGMNQKDEQ